MADSINPADLEAAYKAATSGADTPSVIVTPEGVFTRGCVHGFDAGGNLYELFGEEQAQRIAAAKARLGIDG